MLSRRKFLKLSGMMGLSTLLPYQLLAQNEIPDGFTRQQINVAGEIRHFLIHIPTNAVDLPVIFAFHGGGQTADKMARHWAHQTEQDFIIVCPQASPDYARKWRTVTVLDAGVPPEDVGFIQTLWEEMKTRPEVAPRAYATGFSSGAGMTWQLAHLDRFLADFMGFAPVAQTISLGKIEFADPNALETPKPLLYIHGTADDNWVRMNPDGSIHPTPPVCYRMWLERNQCNRMPDEILSLETVEDDITAVKFVHSPLRPDGAHLEYITVVNGGHSWAGPTARGGKYVCRDFSATDEIVMFWKDYAGL